MRYTPRAINYFPSSFSFFFRRFSSHLSFTGVWLRFRSIIKSLCAKHIGMYSCHWSGHTCMRRRLAVAVSLILIGNRQKFFFLSCSLNNRRTTQGRSQTLHSDALSSRDVSFIRRLTRRHRLCWPNCPSAEQQHPASWHKMTFMLIFTNFVSPLLSIRFWFSCAHDEAFNWLGLKVMR